MKKYPKYKDSGVKWIGEIPSHWKTMPLKRFGRLYKGLTFTKADIVEKGEPTISYGQVHAKINTGTALRQELIRFIPGHITNGSYNSIAHQGDFIFADTSEDYDGCGNCVYNDKDILIYGGYHTIVFKTDTPDAKYLAYLFKTDYWRSQIRLRVYGIKVFSITQSILSLCSIILPTASEQRDIVSYLDKKTSQIDRFISEAKKEIEKLNELKQAQIAHLVTHGLNPDAPMKDSGIAWIGQIPAHWEVKKIRSHFKERRTKVSDKDYPALSVAREGVVPQLETAVKTDNGDNRKLVLKNDFVVNSRSDRKGSCGVSDYDGSVSLISIVLEPHDIYPLYVHYLFRSNNYIEEFYRNGRGIVADLWTTRYSEMRNIFMPIPPIEEQQAIVSAIGNLNTKIDALSTKLTAQINYLKELKQRIISDAVTGKIMC